MTFNNLDEKFGVVSTTNEDSDKSILPVVEDDAQHARETLRNLIDKGNDGFSNMLMIEMLIIKH